MDQPRVLLADGQPVTRLGLRIALEHDGLAVVAEAVDARGATVAAQHHAIDVCLLDAGLPGGAISTVAEISARCPRARIVLLAARHSDDELLAALRAGAVGYLLKDIAPAPLARAVRGAARGEAPLSRTLVARVVEELQTRGGARRVRLSDGAVVTLSPRESASLELLRRGLSTKQIAQQLGVSPVTVRRHLSTSVRRLGASDRDAALRLTSHAMAT
ncbi:response regulator transcription factor [Conexibacter sp. CPCC 206217]|uniref:response regulator n=1 Tax=Conexibacter sp. CPCC 206217 TaxID=3064574 RepID=UPI0027159178|nr:response regulator transcription factor [Conexibacter sp. CPCC 206217]MDO8212479.1 response regulator transcription factor [Conexibacter sp. CPCC 206217]